MAQNLPYRIRAYQPSDEKIVFATWLNSFEPFRDRRVPRDTYYAEHHNFINRRLAAAVASGHFLVACSKDDPETVFGWVCGGVDEHGKFIDYVYVKSLFRRMGIGRALLNAFGYVALFSHYTDAVPWLRLSGLLPPNAIYNPYLRG